MAVSFVSELGVGRERESWSLWVTSWSLWVVLGVCLGEWDPVVVFGQGRWYVGDQRRSFGNQVKMGGGKPFFLRNVSCPIHGLDLCKG